MVPFLAHPVYCVGWNVKLYTLTLSLNSTLLSRVCVVISANLYLPTRLNCRDPVSNCLIVCSVVH